MRTDLALIADMIKPGSRVLDIGCGDGALLHYLATHKQVDGRGIELSQAGVSACVKQGLSVIQGDADHDLIHYPDGCMDYVILGQLLQAARAPKSVLEEGLRIARYVIVSIPNFGYWYNRYYLTVKGRMPVSSTLSYSWYETPNIHFSTIKDFVSLCRVLNAAIADHAFIRPNGTVWRHQPPDNMVANLFCEVAVFSLAGRK